MDEKTRSLIPGHPVSAEEARASGLPMLDVNYPTEREADKHPQWVTATRCRKLGRPVEEGEKPVAYKRSCYGYVALYDRPLLDLDDPPRNQYGFVPAEYCRYTGLPMLSSCDYWHVEDKWMSKTRCAKAGRPVQDGEKPVAWYYTMHGYAPLYDRSGSTP